MLDYFKNYLKQPGLKRRVGIMLLGVLLMEFLLLLMIPIDF